VTTNRDTATWRQTKIVTLAVFTLLTGFGLSGCSSGSGLLGGSGETPVTEAVAPPVAQVAKFAVALPLGPPEASGKLLQDQLKAALVKKNITVANLPTDKSEYTLRGYVVAGADKGKSKVSYIWDVTNAAEKQIHRISGEEPVAAVKGKDQWSSLTPQIAELIAAKTVTSVSAWLPTQAPSAQTPKAPASTAVPVAANTTTPSPGTATAAAIPASPATPATQTGSIARGPESVMPRVTGAPGDGNTSLGAAIQSQLQKNGLTLSSTANAQTYRVEGKVAVSQGSNGKQPITIDWNVFDPAGKYLGVVSQRNEIPQGSVDGAWGQTAAAVAEAAAKGIVHCIRKTCQPQGT
jgi:hypothetical protein